jgi:DNA-binding transcriptional ArsR family regulator
MYFIGLPNGEKFNLKKLDKGHLSKINETKALILDALADKSLYSAKMIQKKLKEKGIIYRIDNVRYHLNELTELNLINRTASTKRTEKLDSQAQYFYKINPEYIGFYYIYSPKEWKYIEQKIPEGRHDLLVILDYHVLNKEGDVVVSEFFMFQNTGNTPIEKQRHWIFTDEGFLTFEELELEVFDGNGNKLPIEPTKEKRGHQIEFLVFFKRPIKKGETYSYWYKRKRKAAFPIGHQHIYYDTIETPVKLLVISITLQEEIRGIKKVVTTLENKKILEKIELPLKPLYYMEDGRLKILWYIPQTIFGSTYTLEWEPKVQ